MAALVAVTKTSCTPWFVRAEHSRYAVAPIFLQISSPCNTLVDDLYAERVGKTNLFFFDRHLSLSLHLWVDFWTFIFVA